MSFQYTFQVQLSGVQYRQVQGYTLANHYVHLNFKYLLLGPGSDSYRKRAKNIKKICKRNVFLQIRKMYSKKKILENINKFIKSLLIKSCLKSIIILFILISQSELVNSNFLTSKSWITCTFGQFINFELAQSGYIMREVLVPDD